MLGCVPGSIYYVVAALERGDFDAAWSRAAQMPRERLGLDHALGLIALMSLTDPVPERYDAAVRRWLQRADVEHPDLPLRRLGVVIDALPDLPAVTELQALCERYRWPTSLAALDHLLPRISR